MDRVLGGVQIAREKQAFVDFCRQLVLEDLTPQSVAMINARGPKLGESSEPRLPSSGNVASLVFMRSRGDLNCDCTTANVSDMPNSYVNPIDWFQTSLNYFYADSSEVFTVRTDEEVLRGAFLHARVLGEMGTSLCPIDERVSQELKEILDTKITVPIMGEEKTVTYKAFYHALAQQGEEPVLVLKSHRMVARILFPESQLSKQPLHKVMNDLDLLLSILLGVQTTESESPEKICLNQGLAKLFGLDKKNAMVFCVQPTFDQQGCIIGYGKPIPPSSYKIALSLSNRLRTNDGYFPPHLRMDCVVKNRTVENGSQQSSNNDIDVPGSMSVSYRLVTNIDMEKEWQPLKVNFSCHPLNYFWFSGDETQQGRLALCPDISGRDHRLNYLLDRSVLRSYTGQPLRAQGRWLDACNEQGKSWQSEWSYTLYKTDADSDAQNEQKKHPPLQFIDIDSLIQELESLSNVLPVWCEKHGQIEANKAFEERLSYLYTAYHTYCHETDLQETNAAKMPKLHYQFKVCVNTLFQSQIKCVGDEKKKMIMYEAWLEKDRMSCIKMCWQAWLPALFSDDSHYLKSWLEHNELLLITQLMIVKESLNEYALLNKIEDIETVLKELKLLIFFLGGVDFLKSVDSEDHKILLSTCQNRADEKKQVLMSFVKEYVARHCIKTQDSEVVLIEQAKRIFDRRKSVNEESLNSYARLEKLVAFECATDDEVSTLSQYMLTGITSALKKKAATRAYVQYKRWCALKGSDEPAKIKLKNSFLRFFDACARGEKKDTSDACLEKSELILQLIEWAVGTDHEKHIEQFWRLEHRHVIAMLGQQRPAVLECFWQHMGGLCRYIEIELWKDDSVFLDSIDCFFKKIEPESAGKLPAYSEQVKNLLRYTNAVISLIKKKNEYQSCETINTAENLNIFSFKKRDNQLGDQLDDQLKKLADELKKLHSFKKEHEDMNDLVAELKEKGFEKKRMVWEWQEKLDHLLNQARHFIKHYNPRWEGDEQSLCCELVRLMASVQPNERYSSLLSDSRVKAEKLEEMIQELEGLKSNCSISPCQIDLLPKLYVCFMHACSQKEYQCLINVYMKLSKLEHKEEGWLILASTAIKSQTIANINDALDKYKEIFSNRSVDSVSNDFYSKYLALQYEKSIVIVKSMDKTDASTMLIERSVNAIEVLSNYRDPTLLNNLFSDCQEYMFEYESLLSAFLDLDQSNEKHLDTVMEILVKNSKNHNLLESEYVFLIFDFLDELIKVKKVPILKIKGFMLTFINQLAKKYNDAKINLRPKFLSKLSTFWCRYELAERYSNQMLELFQYWIDNKLMCTKKKLIKASGGKKECVQELDRNFLPDYPCAAEHFLQQAYSSGTDDALKNFLNIMLSSEQLTQGFPDFKVCDKKLIKEVLSKVNNYQKSYNPIVEMDQVEKERFFSRVRVHFHCLNRNYWMMCFEVMKKFCFSVSNRTTELVNFGISTYYFLVMHYPAAFKCMSNVLIFLIASVAFFVTAQMCMNREAFLEHLSEIVQYFSRDFWMRGHDLILSDKPAFNITTDQKIFRLYEGKIQKMINDFCERFADLTSISSCLPHYSHYSASLIEKIFEQYGELMCRFGLKQAHLKEEMFYRVKDSIGDLCDFKGQDIFFLYNGEEKQVEQIRENFGAIIESVSSCMKKLNVRVKIRCKT